MYLAQQLTGSAFISQSGERLGLKIGVKTKVRAATNASYLGVLLFFTMDEYFILSC